MNNTIPGRGVREGIDDIRQRFYRNVESALESDFVGAREKLNSARSCRDQALQHKQWAQDEYEHYKDYKKVVAKDYKDKVSAWFAELDALYAKAEKLIEAEKYKAVYACSLEFNEVLDARLSRIPREEKTATRQGKTLDGMKKELTDGLRAWIIAAYEHFYWHVDWIKKEREAAKKKRLYEKFMETRREDFIREAMDVEAEETAPVC